MYHQEPTQGTTPASPAAEDREVYLLKLYVAGQTPRSLRAIANLNELLAEHLKGRYELEIVDIYQQPERAHEAELVAAPTLIKELPLPLRRIIGDLSDTEQAVVALRLPTKP
jgi:circadian clock protein KaiB